MAPTEGQRNRAQLTERRYGPRQKPEPDRGGRPDLGLPDVGVHDGDAASERECRVGQRRSVGRLARVCVANQEHRASRLRQRLKKRRQRRGRPCKVHVLFSESGPR